MSLEGFEERDDVCLLCASALEVEVGGAFLNHSILSSPLMRALSLSLELTSCLGSLASKPPTVSATPMPGLQVCVITSNLSYGLLGVQALAFKVIT